MEAPYRTFTSRDEVRALYGEDYPDLTEDQIDIISAQRAICARFLAVPGTEECRRLMRLHNTLGRASRAGLSLRDLKAYPLDPLGDDADDGLTVTFKGTPGLISRFVPDHWHFTERAVTTDVESRSEQSPASASKATTTPASSEAPTTTENPMTTPDAPAEARTAPAPFAVTTEAPSARYGAALTADTGFRSLPEARGVDADDAVLGEYLRGIVTGTHTERSAALAVRAQNEGTATAGGHLVPVALSASILDAVRPASRVMEAGALVIPTASATHKLPTLDEDPTPAWRDEAASITEDAAVFGAVTFTARSLAVLVKASWEVIQDSPADLGAIIRQSLAEAIAQELDRVALFGSGSAPEPKGLVNVSGIDATDLDAEATWDDLLTAIAAVHGRDFTPTAVLLSPTSEAGLQDDRGSDDHFVAPPPMVTAVPRLMTSKAADKIIVGDFSKLAFGIRSALDIIPLREAFASTGQVGFVAHCRADVQVLRPDAFAVLNQPEPEPDGDSEG